MRNELLRDRLVVGIRDSALSSTLQLDSDLTLEKAKTTIRQSEAMRESQRVLQESGSSGDDPINVDGIHAKSRRGGQHVPPRKDHSKKSSQRSGVQGKKHCFRCGRDAHPRDKCPAKDASCYKCGKTGHFSTVCHSKQEPASS